MKAYIITLITGLAVASVAQAAGNKTIDNLNAALRGESNASHKYGLFAKKAKEEGATQAAKLFEAASKAEAIHRDSHKAAIIKLGGKPDTIKLDEVKIGSTKENLAAALKGETYERDVMYPDFIKQATADSAKAALRTMKFALAAETEHVKLYQDAIDNLGKNKEVSYFVCPDCGFTAEKRPNRSCPVCGEKAANFIAFK
jgi:rubrerythrin